jgi:hypothetical protein
LHENTCKQLDLTIPQTGATDAENADGIRRNGAPRSMKMGTIAALWRYDAAADQALRPDSLRWPALLRYVLLALIDAPHFGDGATTSSAATLTFALTEFEMKQ